MATYAYMVGDERRSYDVSEAAWELTDAIERDESLGMAARQAGSLEALAALGRSRGFAVTAAEIAQFVAAVEAAHREMRASEELSDEELDLVSAGGGVHPTVPLCSGSKCKLCCSKGSSSCATCKCPTKCT